MLLQLRGVCLALLLAPGLVGAQGNGEDPVTASTVVIQSGASGLTRADFEELIDGEKSLEGRTLSAEERRHLGVVYGRAFALEAEAKRRKLDERPEIKLRIRSMIQELMAAELLEDVREGYLRDDTGKLAAYYEKVKKQYELPHVRQILIRTKGSKVAARPGSPELSVEEARTRALEVRRRIVGGEDFATVAREVSDDLGTGPKGGDLGFLARGATPASFEAAAYALPAGQVSEPVQTEHGFHIIKVEERQPQPFDKVKKVLANDLAHQDLASMSENVVLNDAYFRR